MSTEQLLEIKPLELKFTFELKKQISCLLELSNKTDDYVAFKVMTTNPMKYCVRPNSGVISPRSKDGVIVTMQKQLEMPPDMQCRDRFLVQSVVTSDAVSSSAEMFSKDSGQAVKEVKLRVVYVAKPQAPSPVPVPEEVEESPTEPSAQANGSLVTKGSTEGAEMMDSPETRALICKLTDAKRAATMQNMLLQQQLEIMKRDIQINNKQQGCFSMFFVAALLIGVLLGYYFT